MFNDKQKIQRHYNLVSPYYHDLWGIHLHHGFWHGNEDKETAQENLTRELVKRVSLAPGSKILDVGCGMGGSSIFLAKELKARVTGITISQLQVAMATQFAKEAGISIRFMVMDADNLTFDEHFDYIWSIEAISHFSDPQSFFRRASNLLPKGGRFAVIDWFKSDFLDASTHKQYVTPIEKGMMVHLWTRKDYLRFLEESNCKIIYEADISTFVSKTWDICLDIIKNRALWSLALHHGGEFVSFLKAFTAMKNGFASRSLQYGIIVAEKIA